MRSYLRPIAAPPPRATQRIEERRHTEPRRARGCPAPYASSPPRPGRAHTLAKIALFPAVFAFGFALAYGAAQAVRGDDAGTWYEVLISPDYEMEQASLFVFPPPQEAVAPAPPHAAP